MASIRRRKHAPRQQVEVPPSAWIFLLVFVALAFLLLLPSAPAATRSGNGSGSDSNHDNGVKAPTSVQEKIQTALYHRRQELHKALHSLTEGNIPYRLRALREHHQIVGERLAQVAAGTETVDELLHGLPSAAAAASSHDTATPMEVTHVIQYLDQWIHQLHETLSQYKDATFEGIWNAYHDLTVKTLYPWDREYLRRMPPRRQDGTIFLSIASYRDENCFHTLRDAYAMAEHPEKLFVGLVQQNCRANCKSGVLSNLSMVEVPPDADCYEQFCQDTALGQTVCARQQVRVLRIDEPESLGPYAARYFASKMWSGESWFMQVDAHMTFAKRWDTISIEMLKKAPSQKPVLSHYPPAHTQDLEKMKSRPGSRLCGPVFATSDLETQIIRLEGGGVWDDAPLEYPAFAPFTAAGYFVAHSGFLHEVPFDPFLPWIFMGEEIIMSTRLWTSGYDIFSPTRSVVGHMYVRRHKPKFWESVHRAFRQGVHNPLQMMILDRIKYQLGYPEAAKDMLQTKSILTAVEQYTMGKARPLDEYMRLVGLNVTTKQVTYTGWCEEGKPPPGFEQYAHLYPTNLERLKAITSK